MYVDLEYEEIVSNNLAYIPKSFRDDFTDDLSDSEIIEHAHREGGGDDEDDTQPVTEL